MSEICDICYENVKSSKICEQCVISVCENCLERILDINMKCPMCRVHLSNHDKPIITHEKLVENRLVMGNVIERNISPTTGLPITNTVSSIRVDNRLDDRFDNSIDSYYSMSNYITRFNRAQRAQYRPLMIRR